MRRLRAIAGVATVVWLMSALPAPAQTTLKESDINLDESNRLADRLRAAGVNVIMTRDDDSGGPSLAARGAMGGRGDFLVSVHNNSSTSSAANGTEVYAQVDDDTSLTLAERVHDAVVAHAGTTPRGVHRRAGQNGDYYSILRNSPVPSVLVEGAFLSNPSDAANLSRAEFRQAVADGIAEAVLSMFAGGTAQGPGPPPPTQGLAGPVLKPPVGLTATVGDGVRLSWQPVAMANVYEIWRDGQGIARTTATSFVDPDGAGGGHRYHVRPLTLLGEAKIGDGAAAGVNVGMGTVVIDPGHGGSDSGATGQI